MCDIWINVLIHTSALVGPLHIDPQPTFLPQWDWGSFTPIKKQRAKNWFLHSLSEASCPDIAIRPITHKSSGACLLSVWGFLHSVSEHGTGKVQRAASHLHGYKIARLHLCEIKVKVNSSLPTPWRRKGERPQNLETIWKWSPSHPGRFDLAKTADRKHSIGVWVGPRAGLVLLEKREMFCPCCGLNPKLFQPIAWSLYRPNDVGFFTG
jgi:hypothetical protein